jgi:inorganic pyrophosphatase
MRKAISKLEPYNEDKQLNVVVETVKGSRGKFKFDPEIGLFRIDKMMPVGMAFPYDFGFIPGTEAEDGDPLDVLMLAEMDLFPGCVAYARPIGVIRALQTEKSGETVENDRVIAVEINSRQFDELKSIDELSQRERDEMQEFFIQYNKMEGRKFKVTAFKGPSAVAELVQKAAKAVSA